jgi:hypothetical protein
MYKGMLVDIYFPFSSDGWTFIPLSLHVSGHSLPFLFLQVDINIPFSSCKWTLIPLFLPTSGH